MDVNFSELLSADCIDLDLKGKKKREIIEEMVAMLVRSGKVRGGQSVVEELIEREKEISTGIGKGVAIPHRLIRGIDSSLIGFGRKKTPVNFDALDGSPVDIFFILLGPEGSANTHLRLLSKLARYLHGDEFLGALRSAQTPREIIDIFVREETL
ncbi:MAG: PTS sugar transporter subunit IIA [Spirochaetia bacterium]|jgi:fructose-specific phosphotransferase system IIA component|nr:PTS sugar transporter subunit IIA [Spirochaetia bacterium]